MHPAYSVILFTTTSGAGLGLLAWLGAYAGLGLLAPNWALAVLALGAAFLLVTIGLVFSTFHLGRPARAWRAFGQWRSSWLSREGIVAVATYVPAAFLAYGWGWLESPGAVWRLSGLAAAALALLTVYCTAMIYASLKTIRHWHHPLVAPVYLALALATGGLLLQALLFVHGSALRPLALLLLAVLIVSLMLKRAYWTAVDNARRSYTVEAATGLGKLGRVRPLDPPHTQPNFVMREMGYKVARKHALRLRRAVLLVTFLIPIALTLVTVLLPGRGVGTFAALLAFVSSMAGVALERWLFFAEAEHVSMLYYGAQAA